MKKTNAAIVLASALLTQTVLADPPGNTPKENPSRTVSHLTQVTGCTKDQYEVELSLVTSFAYNATPTEHKERMKESLSHIATAASTLEWRFDELLSKMTVHEALVVATETEDLNMLKKARDKFQNAVEGMDKSDIAILRNLEFLSAHGYPSKNCSAENRGIYL